MPYYGPEIVKDKTNDSALLKIAMQQRSVPINNNIGINGYSKKNMNETNDISAFGDNKYNKNSNDIVKAYKQFLKKNRNKFHDLPERHINNMLKLMNKQKIKESDIPKSFKSMKINKPIYAVNH